MGGSVIDLLDETVLGRLTESELEGFCSEILEKLGYGPRQNPRNYRDSGEDIRMGSVGSTTIVECRHCPGRTVGRSTVQKIHSAAVASGAKTAMVITTGKFARTAIDYAKCVSTPDLTIELVDLTILRDMAARANASGPDGTRTDAVWMHRVLNDGEFAEKFGEFLNRRFESHPMSPSQMLTILSRKVYMYPSYEVKYRLDALFKTTVGIIHREYEANGILLISGVQGKELRGEVESFYRQFIPVSCSEESLHEGDCSAVSHTLADIDARQVALEQILRNHTTRVSYVGGNGQFYEKVCAPKERDVTISGIRRVFLPTSTTTFTIGEKKHAVTHLDDPLGYFKLLDDSDISTCSRCGAKMEYEIPQLCNACGAITHKRSLFSAHGVTCKDCGMTLCRDCAVAVRRLIIKSPFCRECAEKRANMKRDRRTPTKASSTKRVTVKKTRKVRRLD